MPNLTNLIGHWGYPAIFVVVVLGNIGLPIPEETILGLSGYLVWRGELRFSIVLTVAILSAVTGDNIGYWLGRKYGKTAIERYAAKVMTPLRIAWAERVVGRYGIYGIFVARFLPVARFMAGPLAGAMGLKFAPFFVANFLGAAIYVPIIVAMGYAVGYGFGPQIENLRHIIGRVEHFVLLGMLIVTLLSLGRHAWRRKRFSK